ncbi:MAG: Hsp33 family molecular chaperone HslO [Spirochaetales bacterium]|nr:Hsp33 family molecular chaperone HslO [Spirochaetales bacterium]
MFEGKKNPITRFMIADKSVKCVVANLNNLISDAIDIHKLGPIEQLFFGRGLVAAALISTTVKGSDRLVLNLESDGPAEGFVIETCANGQVKGYPKVNPIPASPDISSFSQIIGEGFLSVSKYIEDTATPFTGTVELVYKDLALDLANFYTNSEQVPTAFLLSINLSPEGKFLGAGGVLIQSMPGAKSEILEKINESVDFFVSPGVYFANGKSNSEYIDEFFSEFGVSSVFDSEIQYSCPCIRGRFKAYLGNLPKQQLEEILAEDDFPVKVNCFNCGEVYDFSKEEVEKMLHKLKLEDKHGKQI